MAAAITPKSCSNLDRHPNLETVLGQVMWSTPSATDSKGSPTMAVVNRRADESSRGVRLPEQMSRELGVSALLNPDWVEWLMGWPSGSTVKANADIKHTDITAEPDIPRITELKENRAQRLKALGNGQVPLCAATAWRVLSEGLT